MGEKKKAGATLIRLVSAAGTGFFYVAKKTKRLQRDGIKLEFRKYDPRVNRHVLFTEQKMNFFWCFNFEHHHCRHSLSDSHRRRRRYLTPKFWSGKNQMQPATLKVCELNENDGVVQMHALNLVRQRFTIHDPNINELIAFTNDLLKTACYKKEIRVHNGRITAFPVNINGDPMAEFNHRHAHLDGEEILDCLDFSQRAFFDLEYRRRPQVDIHGNFFLERLPRLRLRLLGLIKGIIKLRVIKLIKGGIKLLMLIMVIKLMRMGEMLTGPMAGPLLAGLPPLTRMAGPLLAGLPPLPRMAGPPLLAGLLPLPRMAVLPPLLLAGLPPPPPRMAWPPLLAGLPPPPRMAWPPLLAGLPPPPRMAGPPLLAGLPLLLRMAGPPMPIIWDYCHWEQL